VEAHSNPRHVRPLEVDVFGLVALIHNDLNAPINALGRASDTDAVAEVLVGSYAALTAAGRRCERVLTFAFSAARFMA
jgi:hypothetical protein